MKRAYIRSSVEAIPLILYLASRGTKIVGSLNGDGDGLVTFIIEGNSLPDECADGPIYVTADFDDDLRLIPTAI